ncbi:tetratricopeptide repeat protein [Hyphococcus sp.]|uniref:tetratricopeptide repeat protein n=1 Tax=Hyphococcus sp. TaxID=2038636 RepID=UPI0035C69389
MKSFCAAAILGLAVFASPAFAQTEEEASAKYAEQDWEGAAEAYGALIEGDSDNAAYLYYLARSQHELGQYDEAERNYEKAVEEGFANPAFAQYHLARLYMTTGKKKKALAMLEQLAESGGVPGGYVRNTAEFEPLAEEKRFIAVVEALTPCTDPEYRQFDFWLGTWDVTPAGQSSSTATNKISSEHGGCVVLEQYDAGGFTGMSINFYDSNDGHWRQTWMSNAGAALYLKGGLEDGAMVMSDKELADSDTINRITWTPNEDGSVRQHWETSTDDGTSWTTVFDGLYTKKAKD